MQDRYFGDVGDFGKYGLLRAVIGATSDMPDLHLGIVWYLVSDESHNADGRHVSYLSKPGQYRDCDPELFDILRRMVIEEGRPRAVRNVPDSGIFPPTTRYFDRVLDSNFQRPARQQREEYRKRWLEAAVRFCEGCEVIFLDPDNGFEVASVAKTDAKAGKYLFWDEFDRFLALRRTLIVYHHLNRTRPASEQIQMKKKEIGERLPDTVELSTVLFRRGSLRAFFIIPEPAQHSKIQTRVEDMLAGPWSRHAEWA